MKVALLMSGGVDSSYSAYLLKNEGYQVKGFYLKLHSREDKHAVFLRNCEKVVQNLGIDFEVIDAQEEFNQRVYQEFIKSYERGETPNPCALCNPLMKFGLALDIALRQGYERIATGHYARIGEVNGIKRIREARDKSKDQSYFLYAISQEAIDRLIFPLGDMLKEEVKPKALPAMPWLGTLETYKDSQEICFVETDYIDILKRHVDVEKEGLVRNLKGDVIGTHKGYMQYTVGKRKGFSVRGAHEPHFVLDIDAKKNEIIVGTREELAVSEVEAMNRSLPEDFQEGDYWVKIRYRSAPSRAHLRLEKNRIRARFDNPVYGVAKGQALVAYVEDKVFGGGVII